MQKWKQQLGRPDLEDSVLEAFQTPEMRVAKFLRFKTCQRRFRDRAKLKEGKQEEPSKETEMAIAHFKSWLLPTLQRIAILACFRSFVGFAIVTELLPAQTQCFQRIQNFLCVFRVLLGFELRHSCCLHRRCVL